MVVLTRKWGIGKHNGCANSEMGIGKHNGRANSENDYWKA